MPPVSARPRSTIARAAGLVCPMLLLAASAAHAQEAPDSANAPRWWGGIDILAGDPMGPFGERVDDAWGFQLRLRHTRNPVGPWAFHLDLGLMGYGDEYRDLCLPEPVGCRLGAQMGTANDILYVGVGPEYSIWAGRLYGFGTVGVSAFSTTTTLSGLDTGEVYLSSTNQEDTVLAIRVGTGARLPLSRGMRPVTLDLEVAYHHNGVAEYLVEGDIVDNPDGSITIYPNRTEANVVTIQLGVSVGLGRGVVTAR